MENRILTLGKNSMIKSSIILLAIIYVISPIDVVPDVPPVGWTDDAIAILLALFYCFIAYRMENPVRVLWIK